VTSLKQTRDEDSAAPAPAKTQAAASYSSSEVTPREQDRNSPRQSRYEILKYGDDSDDDRMIICEDKEGSTVGMKASILFYGQVFMPGYNFYPWIKQFDVK